MFINLGEMDGFDVPKMLKYLIETTDLPAEAFGRINIKGVYSFIDMEEKQITQALIAFKNEVYKGRKVRVDISYAGKSSAGAGFGSDKRKPRERKEESRFSRSSNSSFKPERRRRSRI
jgi:ATP-dependent RNA helicase DeaD